MAGPPNNETPFMSNALSDGFCFFGFGCGGDLVPDRPGDPMYDFFPLAGPGERCGLTTDAMFPADVDPGEAVSIISFIFMLILIPAKKQIKSG